MADYSRGIEFCLPYTFGGHPETYERGREIIVPFTFEGVINPPPGTGDAIPPTVHSFVPAEGSIIARFQSIAFTVEDTGFDPDLTYAFALIVVMVYFPSSGAYEVAHDGASFAATYAGSTVEVLAPGSTRITLRRVLGWPSSPTIRVRAVDRTGNLDT